MSGPSTAAASQSQTQSQTQSQAQSSGEQHQQQSSAASSAQQARSGSRGTWSHSYTYRTVYQENDGPPQYSGVDHTESGDFDENGNPRVRFSSHVPVSSALKGNDREQGYLEDIPEGK